MKYSVKNLLQSTQKMGIKRWPDQLFNPERGRKWPYKEHFQF